jgi:transcriptional regulator with XRE-family HTH domain
MGRSAKIKPSLINEARKALSRYRIYQQALAERTNMSEGTVSRFFAGKPINYENFKALCEALHLDPAVMFDEEESNTGNPPLTIPSQETMENPEFLFPSGMVDLNSPFYIRRSPSEEHCYSEISNPGALIRIKAPRQLGKTSLMERILNHAEVQGDRRVYLSLQLTDLDSFKDSKTFLNWFITEVTEELNLLHKFEEYQKLSAVSSSTSACRIFFERYLLPELGQPLTLAIDEVDRIFDFPKIYSDFFGLLRVMNEKSKQTGIWQNLRLVISYSTEAYVPIDLNQSPFNVGIPIELSEFTQPQIQDLVARHKLILSENEIQQLMAVIGGHPYLIRLALYYIACQELTLPQILETAWSPKGIYGGHLKHLEKILVRQIELKEAMAAVVAAAKPVLLDTVPRLKLDSLGLIGFKEDGVVPRYEIYRQYFRNL